MVVIFVMGKVYVDWKRNGIETEIQKECENSAWFNSKPANLREFLRNRY